MSAIFVMILRKMVKNRWLECGLLLGLVFTVALAASMPMYTHAILQRLLVKDLERMQTNTGQFSGTFWTSVFLPPDMDRRKLAPLLQESDRFMKEEIPARIGLPLLTDYRERATGTYTFAPVSSRVDATKNRAAQFAALSGIEEHIRLIDGRMPSPQPVDGVYEALVVPEALNRLSMVLDQEFRIRDDGVAADIRVKPVGVIDRSDYRDVYWYSSISSYSSSFLLPFELFEREFTRANRLPVVNAYWHLALDYSQMKLDTVPRYLSAVGQAEYHLASRYQNVMMKTPAAQTLRQYFDKEHRLRLMLWSLNVPVLIVLAFYLFMVANLITERQKTEIAVLRSRGASRWQIILGYLIEGVVLGALALAVGPYLALGLTKLLGASNGFLEFVQRARMEVTLSGEAYRYAGVAVLGSLAMTLVPVLLATRVSIVERKQQMARTRSVSLWHRLYLDVALVGIALYGLTAFRRRMSDMISLGLDTRDLTIDPLLFVVPALFVLGAGLFVLRAYPWLIRLIFWAGRRFWPPALYSTLLQVGRAATQYQFIMVFLCMTVATGLFSASAARTINENASDKISYMTGADIRLTVKWENDAPPEGEMGDGAEPAPIRFGSTKIQYSEPPFEVYAKLPGVESAARVFVKEGYAGAGKAKGAITLMGIDTDDFGRTAWMRDRLLEYHFYNYLNLIAEDPSAVLVSRSLAEEFEIKPGDRIQAGWTGVQEATFNVFGIVDYWPSWNPNPAYGTAASSAGGSSGSGRSAGGEPARNMPKLVVGHLDTIQNNIGLEPYDVWLKLSPNTTSQELYSGIEEMELPLIGLKDARMERTAAKNDPFQLAINGVMTLGFLISTGISFVGFILYWVLSLSGRILQFGIMRAMGISFRQLIGMLTAEQLLTSGAALAIGAALGHLTAWLYVPMFQLAYNAATQVPPFRVTFDPNDSLHLYLIVAAMMLIGLSSLGFMLSRIKIHQAVKLGED